MAKDRDGDRGRDAIRQSMSRTTHTYALLEVSPGAYDEITDRLRYYGWEAAINDEGEIDMHGLALVRSHVPNSTQETMMPTSEQQNQAAMGQLAERGGVDRAPRISLGRTVHYTLSAHDAERINQRRQRPTSQDDPPWPQGAMAHVGNSVGEGDVFPLVVTRVWDADHGTVNGQVQLDGSDTLWVCSVTPGEGPCHWFWPPRV